MFAEHIGRLGLPAGLSDLRVLRLKAGVRRTVSWGRLALCRLRGHEMVLHFEPARLSLQCPECGAETPGWTIDVRPAFRRGGPARAQVHRQAPPRSRAA